jgi:hypothetical protein
MRRAMLALAVAAALPSWVAAAPRPRRDPAARPAPAAPEPPQQQADRHFKAGVALFKAARYAAALAEFEHAYELAPHPVVLYNIAACHRDLAHYPEAVAGFQRLLAEAGDQVPAAQLADARAELASLLAMTAQVTVTVTPASDGGQLLLDGAVLPAPVMPLILAPGEHQLVARAAGRRDAERTLRVAAGQQLTVELALAELAPPPGESAPPPSPGDSAGSVVRRAPPPARSRPWRAVNAGVGMNLRRLGHTGAPSLGLAAALGSRIVVAVDAVLVAYAVVPSLRVRLVGDALSLYVLGAAPIAFSSDPMVGRFVAIGGGLGVRYRPSPQLAVRAEAYLSAPSNTQATSIPMFLGGELWF